MAILPYLGLFLRFLWDLSFPQKESATSIVTRFLRLVVGTCIMVIIIQQATQFWDLYKEKEQEKTNAQKAWFEEECATYRGSSQVRLAECSRNAIIMNSWAVSRAWAQLTKGWNSCLYMPCGEMAKSISTHIEYKILLILIALGISSYLYNWFKWGKKKSSDYLEKKRAKLTHREQEQNLINTLANIVNLPPTVTTMPPHQQQQQQQKHQFHPYPNAGIGRGLEPIDS